MKRLMPLLLIILLVLPLCGCTGGTSSEATGTPSNENMFASVVQASVFTLTDSWDADAEDDGVVLYPDLRDAQGETVKWDGTTLSVSIEIWTTRYDNSFNEIKDRIAYSGTGTISSWRDGNWLIGGGIRIPYEDINSYGEEFGWCYATIHTPSGDFSAVDKITRIRDPTGPYTPTPTTTTVPITTLAPTTRPPTTRPATTVPPTTRPASQYQDPRIYVYFDKGVYYPNESFKDHVTMWNVFHDGEVYVKITYGLYNPYGIQILSSGTVQYVHEYNQSGQATYSCDNTMLQSDPPGIYTLEVELLDLISGLSTTGTATFELKK